MSTIIVSQVLNGTKAISADSGQKIRDNVLATLQDNDNVTVDFSGIRQYTTMFFNAFVADLIINHISPAIFDEKVELTGLSQLGKSTYLKSYNNALNYDKDNASIKNEIILSIE